MSLDFNDSCPICGGKNCALFIGYYVRTVVDDNGTIYTDFPIARFLCRRKNKPKINHRTFSLLPYQLIPYRKFSIPFIIKIFIERYIRKKTINEILASLASLATPNDKELSAIPYIFQKFIIETIEKLILSRYYLETIKLILLEDKVHMRIKKFIIFAEEFECHKVVGEPIRGSPALSYDYYLKGGSYIYNSHFLFGTPSQFR